MEENWSQSLNANELPPVAKSFHAFCSKCDTDRYHKVIAHTSATTAKLKCEVCGSTKKFTLPRTQERKSPPSVGTKSSASTTKSRGNGSAAARAARSQNARLSAYKSEYASAISCLKETRDYNMKTKFEKGFGVQHPKFGLGYVQEVAGDRMDVAFSDEVRRLLHNRA